MTLKTESSKLERAKELFYKGYPIKEVLDESGISRSVFHRIFKYYDRMDCDISFLIKERFNLTNIVKHPLYRQIYVSDLGDVFSNNKKGIIKLRKVDTLGYHIVSVFNEEGKKLCRKVHRLVLEGFVSISPHLHVNHKNYNRTDNRLSNLEYCTSKENNDHKNLRDINYAKGLKHPHVKEKLYCRDKLGDEIISGYGMKPLGFKLGYKSAVYHITKHINEDKPNSYGHYWYSTKIKE